MQKLGFPAAFKDFKVQNIVASADVRFPVRLEGLAYSHGFFCSYEPELFPGLIYRMKSPKVVLLVFVSGKVVLTGERRAGARARGRGGECARAHVRPLFTGRRAVFVLFCFVFGLIGW